MAILVIDVGTFPNDNTGDALRDACIKVNANFDHVMAVIQAVAAQIDGVIQGPPGEKLQIQVSETHVQWKYESDLEWTNLIALSELGEGPAGDDGREVELSSNSTHILWRYVGESAWNELVALSEFPTQAGNDGKQIELQVSGTELQWRYIGESWAVLFDLNTLAGSDGREIELSVTSTDIVWRYSGGTWATLISLSEIKGDKGDAGTQIELRVFEEKIQWRLVTSETWTDLLPLTDITAFVEFRVNNSNLEWKYVTDSEWIILTSLWELLGYTRKVKVVSENYLALPQDRCVLGGNTTKSIEVSLAEIETVGLQDCVFRKTVTGTYAFTVLTSGADQINFDGVLTTGLTTIVSGSSIELVSDDETNVWYVISGGENWNVI